MEELSPVPGVGADVDESTSGESGTEEGWGKSLFSEDRVRGGQRDDGGQGGAGSTQPKRPCSKGSRSTMAGTGAARRPKTNVTIICPREDGCGGVEGGVAKPRAGPPPTLAKFNTPFAHALFHKHPHLATVDAEEWAELDNAYVSTFETKTVIHGTELTTSATAQFPTMLAAAIFDLAKELELNVLGIAPAHKRRGKFTASIPGDPHRVYCGPSKLPSNVHTRFSKPA